MDATLHRLREAAEEGPEALESSIRLLNLCTFAAMARPAGGPGAVIRREPAPFREGRRQDGFACVLPQRTGVSS